MTTPCIPWQSWAPPLNPPVDNGLPVDQAQCIADAYWATSPHLAAALMWEAYAATLPPQQAVASVSTGTQSVSYGAAVPGGELGLALSRAEWHRSFVSGQLVTIPLVIAPLDDLPAPSWSWG